MSRRFAFRPCRLATSSRGTIPAPIKSPAFAKPSRPPWRRRAFCQPTALISTRLILRRAREVFADSAGFSTNLRLLEPEAGFAQKRVAQNGTPNRRCSVGWPRKRSRRLPSKRRLQSFPNCRIWLHLIGIRSSTDVRDTVVRTGRIIVTWAENVFQKNPLAFASADSGHRRQRRSFRRGPLAAPASARSQVLAPCPDDWDCRRDS